jgi:hypothetical protein
MDTQTADLIRDALAEADRADVLCGGLNTPQRQSDHDYREQLRRPTMTDAQILRLITDIVDEKVLLVIDTVGSEMGDVDSVTAKQIAELRVQVGSLTKAVSRLRAMVANIQPRPRTSDLAGSTLAEDRARKESGVIALRSRS